MSAKLGRRALVTGASRGIGRATALALANDGCDVAINFITREEGAQETAKQIQDLGRRAIVIKADMREPEDIESMVGAIGDAWGGLDVIVSNAASGGFRELVDAKPVHFDSAMHTNVRALMLLVQAGLPWLAKSFGQAKVIALSSHGSHRALPAYSLIGASKAAIESLIRHMALELGPKGINFNVVLAGLVRTDSTSHVPDAETMFASMDKRLLVAKDRTLLPEDVAEVVRFLASSSSDLIQGQTIIVDGGACLTVG